MSSAPLPTERQVQRAILQMAGTCFRHVLIHHSPNGAHLAGNSSARFRQMGALLGDGMKPGWPDLTCVWGGGVAFIEVKRPKLGKLSIQQEGIHEILRGFGWPVATVTSQEEAFEFLKSCGAPCNAEIMGRAA